MDSTQLTDSAITKSAITDGAIDDPALQVIPAHPQETGDLGDRAFAERLHDSRLHDSFGTAMQPSLPAAQVPPIGLPAAHQQTTWVSLVDQLGGNLRNAAPLIAADMLTAVIALLAADGLNGLLLSNSASSAFVSLPRLLCLVPAILASLGVLGLYPGIGMSPVVELRKLTLAASSVVIAVLAASVYSARPVSQTVGFCLILWPTLLIALPLSRAIVRGILSRRRWWGERVLIFGGGPEARRVYEVLSRESSRGMRPLGVVDSLHDHWSEPASDSSISECYLGPPEDALDLVRKHNVKWAIVAGPLPLAESDWTGESDDLQQETHAVWQAMAAIPNRLVIGHSALPSLWTESRECAGVAAFHVGERLLMPWPQAMKRFMDLTMCLLGGLFALPIIGLIALAVKFSSRGPIFFAHDRIGRNGRRFKVWKFRTMVVNADELLHRSLRENAKLREEWMRDQKLKRDPRVTAIGRFLRSSSLDELPQLWNVICGEMSLVGPRPIIENEIAKYKHIYPMYTRVTPGLTGLWQISGRNRTTYDERIELDNYYVTNWSPWLDVYILARTVRTVLLREGAY